MRQSLHVCFINISFGQNSIGGVMNHMVALGKALQSQEVSVSVICPAWSDYPWRYLHDGIIDVIGIKEPRIDWKLHAAMVGFGWRCGSALLDLDREKPIDVIHLHDRAPFIGATWAGWRLRVPVIYTAHSCLHIGAEQWPAFSHHANRFLERRIARSGTPVISVSKWISDGMITIGADPHRATIIPNGVDLDTFPYRGHEGRNPGEILFVGRYENEKGFDVLLQALQRVASASDVTLTAVGTGSLEVAYRELARELGISDRVKFVGRLFGAELVAAYHRASVFVLPSRSEPFGLVMLEAMACGTPFVGTAVGGVAEVAEHEQTGLLVPSEDPAAMAAAISRLLSDDTLARRLAENARRMIEQQFSWEIVAKETRRFYDGVITTHQPLRLETEGQKAVVHLSYK